MSSRYQVNAGSQSAHCCFKFTVVDTKKPQGYKDHCDPVCECFELEDARMIADALNLEVFLDMIKGSKLYEGDDV